MNDENINTNEEVNEVEVYEDYDEVNSGLGWKIIGGVLATAGAILGGMKLKKMIKAKKEKDKIVVVENTENCDENEVVEDVKEKKSKKKN